MLLSWRSQYKNHKEIAFPGNGNKMQTEAEKEISRLQKELADARMERDTLKKAISISSSRDRKNMRS